MGSANDVEKLTFEVRLPNIKRLVIHHSNRISNSKLSTIKEALDSGLSRCLSEGQEQPIRNLIEDLKNFQQTWCNNTRFLSIDEAEQTCHLHLMVIQEPAHLIMLSNKVTSRLNNSQFLVPPSQTAAAPAQNSTSAIGAGMLKPRPAPKPQKPPKSPALAARMALRRHESESSVTKPSSSLPVSTVGNALSASTNSVAASDSAGSDLSDIKEESQSPKLDLRKTFYSEDIFGGSDSAADAEAAMNAAAAQNFACANALEELISTEKKYIRRMELLSDHYYPRVSADLPHLAGQLSDIFQEFETFKKLHQELLMEVEKVSREADGDISRFRLGPVMAKYGKHLLLYSTYYLKYKQHLNQISEWMHDEACKAAFQRARNDCPEAADRMLDVTSHMLEPVQRPLRYPMLMSRYLKEIGTNHSDYERAKQALAIIEKVTDGFNVKMSEVESMKKLLDILAEVIFPAELQEAKMNFMCSQYLMSAKVLKISSKNRQQIRFLILSSTMLLLCEVSALNWKTVQMVIPVDSSLVLTLDEKLSADYPNCIRLKTQQKTYDISFGTLDEFDQWIAGFKRLNVTFGDSNPDDEKFPWKTFKDEDLGRKQPMKLKDQDVSQCQACNINFNVVRRRHHCRLCGGIFCGGCSKYECPVAWAKNEPKRACFFCRDRINRRDCTNWPLDSKHRDLIDKFNKRNSDARAAVIQGYLNVRVDVKQEKKEKAPGFLRVHWVKMWCTVENSLLNIYRMKNDFVAGHTVVLPMNLTVEMLEDASEIQLNVTSSNGIISTCRLRMTDESSLRSSEREASHLHEWFDILKKESEALSPTS
ncbi:hypothetical protein BOX15_Mlig008710g2 [Macrostomum lignano]|uniref:FYVE-type domain-containing protein n=1 Tax=Macrostomum lignano TaxID=282301 RepID=A0A267G4B7_9PLAT|nr:hypothetical protein BOX15_Mlig008710g2 [Macrostomum lignano]